MSYPLDATSTETYDIITISFVNRSTTNLEGSTAQSGSVTIAIAVGAGQGDGGTETIEEVLNDYIVTSWEVGTAIAIT